MIGLVCCVLLVAQCSSAAKYASSGGGTTDLGTYITNQLGSAEPTPAQSTSKYQESVFEMPEYVQTGPSYQGAGGMNVPAAIQTRRTVEVKPISLQSDPVEPHVVDVEASYQPVHVVFRSSSSPVMIQQIHTPSQPMKVESTQSEDEPHRVQHQVMRPVIQEVREIIQPYRRVLQEVRPVLEEVRTVVAKAQGSNVGGGGGAGGSGGSGLGAGSGIGGGAGAGGYGANSGSYGGSSGAYGASSGGYGGSSSGYASSNIIISGGGSSDVGYASSNTSPVASPARQVRRSTRKSHKRVSSHKRLY